MLEHSHFFKSQVFLTQEKERCAFLFNSTILSGMSDMAIGIVILILSLLILSTCLVLLVKVLQALLKGLRLLSDDFKSFNQLRNFTTGPIADLVRRTLNSDLPHLPWLTGYVAILAGAVLTFLVQSSSVFTSTITPLVGVGFVTVERVYPLTLGSNLGTTTTALLAAMAADQERIKPTMQISLCHLFFNLTGKTRERSQYNILC